PASSALARSPGVRGPDVVALRRFQQSVDDQLATLFGLPLSGGPKAPGHYFGASARAGDAQGWAVFVRPAAAQRIHRMIDYSVSRATWIARGDMAALAVWAPAAVRPR